MLRKIDFISDYDLVEEFNRTARFPIVSSDIDTSDIDEYFEGSSIEGFALGIFENSKLIANIQCSTAGFLALDGDSAFMFLTNQDIVFSIETLPEYRHRGYANKLLQHAFELAPGSMFVGIIEHKDIISGKLKSFYDSVGFDVSRYENGLVVYPAE